MEIYYVNCPHCEKSFHCDANLSGLNLPRHCPHCDLYFDPEEERARRSPRGTAFTGISRIDREIIYIPGEKKKGSP